MKPLHYFAQCPQTEALDWAWAKDLSDSNKQWVARAIILALNNEIALNVWTTHLNPATDLMSMKQIVGDWATDKDIPVVGKILLALNGMPIEHCRGCIDYFNQF